MAGVSLRYVPDDARVRQLFADLTERVRDLTPVLKVMCQQMDRSKTETFATEGHGQWLQSKRVERAGDLSATKQRVGGALKTLRLTGLLERSTHWVPTGPNEIRGGTPVVYGRIHQLGGHIGGVANVDIHVRTIREAFGRPIKPTQVIVGAHQMRLNTTIVPRPFLVVQPQDEAYFVRELVVYLTRPAA